MILIFFVIVKLVDGGNCAIKSDVAHEHTVKWNHHQTLTSEKPLHCLAALSEIDYYHCTDVTMSFSVIKTVNQPILQANINMNNTTLDIFDYFPTFHTLLV